MSITFITKFPHVHQHGFDQKEYYGKYLTSNVVINASSKNVSYEMNTGSPLTIKYVFRGEEYYFLRYCKYRVNSERFIVFNEWQQYGSYIDSDELTESFSVFFRPEYVSEVLNSLLKPEDEILANPYSPQTTNSIKFIEKFYNKDKYIVPILMHLRKALKDNFHTEDYFNEQLYFLLEGILNLNRSHYNEIKKVSAVRSSTKTETYRRLNVASDYLRSCYNEKISLQSLSKAANMCEHHLLREFKKYFKQTPYQFLLKIRMETAGQMLRTTNQPVSEISYRCGFEYLSSFSQSFVKYFGVSPTRYRNQIGHL